MATRPTNSAVWNGESGFAVLHDRRLWIELIRIFDLGKSSKLHGGSPARQISKNKFLLLAVSGMTLGGSVQNGSVSVVDPGKCSSLGFHIN